MSFIAYAALIFVCLGIVVRVSNGLRFSLGRPADSATFNYVGSWKSQSAPLVSGKILANIPCPPPTNEQFEIRAFIYYDITSIFRLGQFVPIELEGFIHNSGTTSGSNSENPIVLPPQITFKSTGGAGGAQKIDYVSTSDSNFTRFAGGYLSESPYDIGSFSIKKTR